MRKHKLYSWDQRENPGETKFVTIGGKEWASAQSVGLDYWRYLSEVLTRGLGVPEVRICYERAESLCHSLDHPLLLYVTLMGQWRHTLETDSLSAALQVAERACSLAEKQDYPTNDLGIQRFGSDALLFGRFRLRSAICYAVC